MGSVNTTIFINGLPQPVITTDLNGIIDNCNKAAEKFLSYSKPNLINQSIHNFLLPKHCHEKSENLFHILPKNEIVSKQFQLKKSDGEVVFVLVSLSNISTDEHQVTGFILTITDVVSKSSRFHQLEIVNQLLSSLGDDYRANINCITALCGELLGASSALYNRLENNLLCSFGKWNAPVDYKTEVDPVGHICFDVINIAQNEAFYVKDLDKTFYAETDPNVSLYGLKTYLGQVVRCNGQAVGSLCVVFQHDYEYTETDRYLLRLLALALEGEETRES